MEPREEWVEMGKEWVEFLEMIDYPYGARAYRTRIGDERMTGCSSRPVSPSSTPTPPGTI